MARIGFIGLGNMGLPMAQNLIKAGHAVEGVDINPDAVEKLKAAGGAGVETAKTAAARADVVITMLPAGPDVNAAVLGDGGVAEGLDAGKVLIDMSSSQPWLTVELAKELEARGIAMIDSPVSGGTTGAEAGTLTLMVGGEDALVERCLPVLQSMARHIFRIGKVGSGHVIKTLNNMLSAMNTMAAAEVLLIGKRFGLDPEVMVDVINESTGMNGAMKRNMKQEVISRKFGGGFAWDLKFKDFGIAMELAQRTATPVPLCGMAFQLNQAAGIWMGDTTGKTSVEIVRWMEHMAKTEIRKDD